MLFKSNQSQLTARLDELDAQLEARLWREAVLGSIPDGYRALVAPQLVSVPMEDLGPALARALRVTPVSYQDAVAAELEATPRPSSTPREHRAFLRSILTAATARERALASRAQP